MILSLQVCMAVGKTTAVRYIQENAPYIHISYEINTDVVDEVKRRNLDKNKFEDKKYNNYIMDSISVVWNI